MSQNFGIDQALKNLGLQDVNLGTSTGSNNFSTGELLESYSPVDGKLIGKVKATTKEDYEKVMATATEAFKTFRTAIDTLVLHFFARGIHFVVQCSVLRSISEAD
jgi:aldehyde dehydrogenase (NAD+)